MGGMVSAQYRRETANLRGVVIDRVWELYLVMRESRVLFYHLHVAI